jgi:hypothetical protein
MRMTRRTRIGVGAAATLLAVVAAGTLGSAATQAASSKGCDGGSFAVTVGDGSTVRGDQRSTIAAARLGTTLRVRGRYVEFDVASASFAVFNHTFTGAPNPLDMTGAGVSSRSRARCPTTAGLRSRATCRSSSTRTRSSCPARGRGSR